MAVKASYSEEHLEIGHFFQNNRKHHHRAAILVQYQVSRLSTACELDRKRYLKQSDHLGSESAGLKRPDHFQSSGVPLICRVAIDRALEVSNRDLDLHQAPICQSVPCGQDPDLVHDLGRSLLLSDCEVARNHDLVRSERNFDLVFGPNRLYHRDWHILHEPQGRRSLKSLQVGSYVSKLLHSSLS